MKYRMPKKLAERHAREPLAAYSCTAVAFAADGSERMLQAVVDIPTIDFARAVAHTLLGQHPNADEVWLMHVTKDSHGDVVEVEFLETFPNPRGVN